MIKNEILSYNIGFMNQSDATFELVKALTQNEKRYFSVASGASGKDKNYLTVFNALDKMKTYDSGVLNKKLGGKKLNVSYEKNYLHKQILKTLRAFYSEGNSAMEVQEILKSLELLYRKRLNSQCQTLVHKGMAICNKHELWAYHLEFIDWQYRIYARTGNYKKLLAYEREGLKEKKGLLNSIHTYSKIQNEIYSVVTIAQSQSVYAEKEIKGVLKKTIGKSLVLLKKHKTSFRISELLYSTLYLAAHYSGDLKGAYDFSLANYKLYSAHPHFKTDLSFKFFVAIGNLINRCIFLKKHGEGLHYISELKLFVKQLSSFASQEIQQEQYSVVYEYETRILLSTHQYSDALKTTQEFERNYNTKGLRRNILLLDSVKFARVYFVNGLLRESLRRVNVLINENAEGLKLDFFTYAHLIRLCIQYDLKKQDVLGHLTQTAQRFFEKHKIEDGFAYLFVDIIKQISKTDTEKIHKLIFTGNLARLKKLLTETFEHYRDLIEWVEAKTK
jgi:hypothetical protein